VVQGTAAQLERTQAAIAELRDLCWLPPAARPRVLVSSCLLGEAVRWDGGDKRHERVRALVGEFAETVAICPEVGSGMAVPRPPLVLAAGGAAGAAAADGVALVERDGGRDHTGALARFAVAALATAAPLDGLVFKAKSPSCGPRGVAIGGATAGRPLTGAGLFVRHARRALPACAELDETALGRRDGPLIAAAFRLACEWNLAWRLASAQWRSAATFVRFHRKLRGWWHALDPRLLRRLERIAAAGSGSAAGYARLARAGLSARLAAPQHSTLGLRRSG